MKIQIGDIFVNEERRAIVYQNKTCKYITPLLSSLGVDFVMKYNTVFKLAIGIGDFLYTEDQKIESHLFILLKSTIAPLHFRHFLAWIKEQDYYRDDYVFDNIQKSDMHMVVIKMPELVTNEALTQWTAGNYSKMYPITFVDRFFKDFPNVQKVLIKDHNYKIEFVKEVNEKYETDVTPEEFTGELDFKPTESEEYFNDHFKK